MAATRGYSVHGVERIQGYTGLLFFSPWILSVLIYPAWLLFHNSEDGSLSERHVLIFASSLSVLSGLLTVYGARLGGYLVASEFGLIKRNERESRQLRSLPLVFALSLGILMVSASAEMRWSMRAFGLLFVCAVVLFVSMVRREWRRAIRSYNIPVNDLVHTLAPRWPVGSPGSDVPMQLPPVSSYAHRVLAVRTSDAVAVLRLIHDHTAVETLCFLPRLPFRRVLVGVFPWIEKVIPLSAVPLDEAQPEKLADLVADWGNRSHLQWHGVLDDGTQVVRNEGEVRIVPLGGERFEAYRSLLAAYGAEIGIQQYYIQAGSELLVEPCKTWESHSLIG